MDVVKCKVNHFSSCEGQNISMNEYKSDHIATEDKLIFQLEIYETIKNSTGCCRLLYSTAIGSQLGVKSARLSITDLTNELLYLLLWHVLI